MVKPTFIGIGAQKCASTWLFEILSDHPEVTLGEPKELDFFSRYYDHGFQWYERHFAYRPGVRAVGEISPSYFHEPLVPSRVESYLPHVKILLSLRDPVERAISNHKHQVRTGLFRGVDLSFEAGLANNPMYIEQGLYATHLSKWFEYFPRDQILVVLFEDILADPLAVAHAVYTFVGVDSDHRAQALNRKSNESHIIRYPLLDQWRKRLRARAKAGGLDWLWKTVGRLRLQKLYRSLNRLPSEHVVPPVADATVRELRVRFADEVARTEELIHRLLDHWR
ncbi:MAG: sulfotransferase [Chromatiales bacterium]